MDCVAMPAGAVGDKLRINAGKSYVLAVSWR